MKLKHLFDVRVIELNLPVEGHLLRPATRKIISK